MTHKADMFDTLKQHLNLYRIGINIIRKNVFINRLSRACVNKIYYRRVSSQFCFERPPHRQLTQKTPAIVTPVVLLFCLQNIAGPEACLLRPIVEICRLVKGRIIVVAQNAPLGLLNNQVQTFLGVWPVADNISETINRLDAALFNVAQNRGQGLQVRMYITYNCKHTSPPSQTHLTAFGVTTLINKNNPYPTQKLNL